MDPKRKKIYIAVIAVSLLLAVGVLWWGGILGGGAGSEPETTLVTSTPDRPANATTTPEGEKSFSPPSVFPRSSSFDTSVLESSTFKALKTYKPLKLDKTEVGRDDPFKNY